MNRRGTDFIKYVLYNFTRFVIDNMLGYEIYCKCVHNGLEGIHDVLCDVSSSQQLNKINEKDISWMCSK